MQKMFWTNSLKNHVVPAVRLTPDEFNVSNCNKVGFIVCSVSHL